MSTTPESASPPAVRPVSRRARVDSAKRTAGTRPRTPARRLWRTRLRDPLRRAGGRLLERLLTHPGPARWP